MGETTKYLPKGRRFDKFDLANQASFAMLDWLSRTYACELSESQSCPRNQNQKEILTVRKTVRIFIFINFSKSCDFDSHFTVFRKENMESILY